MSRPLPFSGPGANPLQLYLRGEAVAINEINNALRDASADMGRRINKLESKNGIGSIVRRAQLAILRRETRTVQKELWRRVGRGIRSASTAVADAASQAERTLQAILFNSVGQRASEELIEAQKALARRTVANYLARGVNGIGLSDRVYRTERLAGGLVDRAINRVIIQGGGWQEIAKAVRPMVDPNTPGGVSYAAKRLGRTELNNAFHTTQRESAEVNPFVIALQWHLSRSHPRPDRCDELARGHSEGKGLGIYLPRELPRKPHPQCLCYTTNEMMEEEDFLEKVIREDEEDFLEPYREAKTAPATTNVISLPTRTPQPKMTSDQRTVLDNLEKESSEVQKARDKIREAHKVELRKQRDKAPLSQEEREELLAYVGNSQPINTWLRANDPDRSDFFGYGESAKVVERIVANHKLEEDGVYFRGVSGELLNQLRPGDKFQDLGFSSTTSDPRIAIRFMRKFGTKGGGRMMIIEAPRGTPGLFMSDAEEAEVLMQANQRFRVLEVTPLFVRVTIDG